MENRNGMLKTCIHTCTFHTSEVAGVKLFPCRLRVKNPVFNKRKSLLFSFSSIPMVVTKTDTHENKCCRPDYYKKHHLEHQFFLCWCVHALIPETAMMGTLSPTLSAVLRISSACSRLLHQSTVVRHDFTLRKVKCNFQRYQDGEFKSNQLPTANPEPLLKFLRAEKKKQIDVQ